MVVDDMNSNPKPSSPSVAWYSDPQPILFDQIDLGQGALFERDEIPAAPVDPYLFRSGQAYADQGEAEDAQR